MAITEQEDAIRLLGDALHGGMDKRPPVMINWYQMFVIKTLFSFNLIYLAQRMMLSVTDKVYRNETKNS